MWIMLVGGITYANQKTNEKQQPFTKHGYRNVSQGNRTLSQGYSNLKQGNSTSRNRREKTFNERGLSAESRRERNN